MARRSTTRRAHDEKVGCTACEAGHTWHDPRANGFVRARSFPRCYNIHDIRFAYIQRSTVLLTAEGHQMQWRHRLRSQRLR